ncbi:hypothetical protein AA0119_g12837, partial [Alternaria tenuissima]
MALTPQQRVLDSLKSSLASGAYSDLDITCGGDTHKVHKVIICGRAGFFARAIKFGGQETQTDQINLPKDERKRIKLLVQYLYEGEYDPVLPPTAAQTTTPAVVTSAAFVNKNFPSISFPHTCHSRGFDGYTCRYRELCPHHKCDRD